MLECERRWRVRVWKEQDPLLTYTLGLSMLPTNPVWRDGGFPRWGEMMGFGRLRLVRVARLESQEVSGDKKIHSPQLRHVDEKDEKGDEELPKTCWFGLRDQSSPTSFPPSHLDSFSQLINCEISRH